ncbi:hypothetical protein ANO14919_011050 [Xylariales sp. No.14919]|nr:hypothetical protein ANO14919_011050 [Xylariales sp. No.14919]
MRASSQSFRRAHGPRRAQLANVANPSQGTHIRFYRPKHLEDLLHLRYAHPDAALLSWSLSSQAPQTYMETPASVFISTSQVATMRSYTLGNDNWEFGCGITYTELETILSHVNAMSSPSAVQYAALARRAIGDLPSKQIKCCSTIGGSLMSGNALSDVNMIFVVLGGVAVLKTLDQEREVSVYRLLEGSARVELGEVCTKVIIPIPKDLHIRVHTCRQGRQRKGDRPVVLAAFMVVFDDSYVVLNAAFYFAEAVDRISRARRAEKALIGNHVHDLAVRKKVVEATYMDLFGANRNGERPNRHQLKLVAAFSLKFLDEIGRETECIKGSSYNSATRFDQGTLSPLSDCQINRVPPLSGLEPTSISTYLLTGEAQFLADVPEIHRQLYCRLVMSSKARALIKEIDLDRCKNIPGFCGFVDHSILRDPLLNYLTTDSNDTIFTTGEVFCSGQVIGLVVCESEDAAILAARKVRIKYEELPATLSLDDAITSGRFFDNYDMKIERGIVDSAMPNAEFTLSGTSRIGGQSHFYLETHGCRAIPHPGPRLEIWSTTQSPSQMQHYVARACQLPMSQVSVRVKRLGGGFGGKGYRSFSLAIMAALTAQRYQRPVHLALSREDDMRYTGGRHPFQARWKVGTSRSGILQALDVELFCGAGWSDAESGSVCNRALWSLDGCYAIPHMRVRGRLARTNTASCTAFRGFGVPQGTFVIESIIEELSQALGLPAEELRALNFYNEGQATHFGQTLVDWSVPALWEKLKIEAHWENRRAQANEFNRIHRWMKRGLAMVPTKFGVAFSGKHLNQAGAFVQILADGSVLLSHGGVDMGQGIHQKMIRLAAEVLEVPAEQIHVSDTSTQIVPNTSPTAGSTATDLNGGAVLDACRILAGRLRPYRVDQKGCRQSMAKAVTLAIRDGVNLSCNGFYITPGLTDTWGRGKIFDYFTQGVAMAEVEDIGRSIIPAVDLGQIEGAFMQGVGLFAIEDQRWDAAGSLVTANLGQYRIPNIHDVPKKFNVSFLDEQVGKTAYGLGGSRGVGEPPLSLGSAVLFAIRDALVSSRQSEKRDNPSDRLVMDSPVTMEKIKQLCPSLMTLVG